MGSFLKCNHHADFDCSFDFQFFCICKPNQQFQHCNDCAFFTVLSCGTFSFNHTYHPPYARHWKKRILYFHSFHSTFWTYLVFDACDSSKYKSSIQKIKLDSFKFFILLSNTKLAEYTAFETQKVFRKN